MLPLLLLLLRYEWHQVVQISCGFRATCFVFCSTWQVNYDTRVVYGEVASMWLQIIIMVRVATPRNMQRPAACAL